MDVSDKIESGYWARYLERFKRFEPRTILELGVLQGASLDLWRERFPDAQIVGIDRDPPESNSSWQTITGEQDDVGVLVRASLDRGGYWDLVVDDCEHVGAKSEASFWALWPYVRSGGCYVVEDWGTGYWPGWIDHDSGHSMVDFVKSLVDHIDDCGSGDGVGIRSVEFVPGQVFIWKA